MRKREILNIICLALAATALFGGSNVGRAQAEETNMSPVNIISIRNPENVPKLRSTTNAQREEAARRAAEYRAEAGRTAALKNTRISGATTPGSPVPQKETGGKNE